MRGLKRRTTTPLVLFVALSLFAAACGDDDDEATPATTGSNGSVSSPAAGGSDPSEVSGEINVSGSSTVAPITTRVAELFAEVAPDVDVNVDGPGTGDGFQLFCEGDTDISDASRAISQEEAEACAAAGIEFVELKVGIDGLTIMTNPANTAVECLSFADLYALTGPESQGFSTWAQAQPIATALGSTTQLPDVPLVIAGPGEESGTYDSYVELVIESAAEPRVEAGEITEDEAAATRPDYQSSSDDNIIVQAVVGADTSLGWVGYSYAVEQGDAIKQLAVSEEVGGECVAPTVETISSAEYPIARFLYIYVNKAKAEESPALGAFVDYYLGDGIEAVTEVGYVDIPAEDLEATKEVWEARTVGTRDGGE